MYNFKINSIKTKSHQTIKPSSLNIIIGPNNSGKSQFLKDIKNVLQRNNGQNATPVIIDEMEYILPENVEQIIDRYKINENIFKTNDGQYYIKNFSGINNYMFETQYSFDNYLDSGNVNISQDWKKELEEIIFNFQDDVVVNEKIKKDFNLPESAVIHEKMYAEYEEDGETKTIDISGGGYPITIPKGESINRFIDIYGSLFMNYLGTEEKLLLCKKQKSYGLEDSSTNFLSEVQSNMEVLNGLSAYTKKLFGKDIYLDRFTGGSSLVFRVGEDFKFIRNADRADSNAERKLSNYNILDNEGDGLKGFVTNYLALNINDKNILLLDEPESFLHPPLARQLGEIIGESENDKRQIFVATHSVELLKGILSKAKDVNIIRITRPDETNNKIIHVNKDILNKIMKDPLLKVSRVMEGLFCERVVITESEADELIYQDIIEKLFPQSGLYFAHGQNKQTSVKIASLYQALEIEYEIITDFDAIRVSKEFNSLLSVTPFKEKEKQKMVSYSNKLREMINESVDVDGLSEEEAEKKKKNKRDDVYHECGISFFEEQIQDLIRKTLNRISDEHIHILESGELETLLVDYKVPYNKDKKAWIMSAIKKLSKLRDVDIPKESYLYRFINKIVG
ncbi:MAG: AAA family ATPase [Firmicutes bacterium]|nr:AAA family ATPase [Bacillota bacterium]